MQPLTSPLGSGTQITYSSHENLDHIPPATKELPRLEDIDKPSPKTLLQREINLGPCFPVTGWSDSFKSSSAIETPRLYMQHLSFVEEEIELIRSLIQEFQFDEARYTIFKHWYTSEPAKEDFIEYLMAEFCKHHMVNGFYGRVWVIRDKKTKSPIGLFQTGAPNEKGFCGITRHIIKKYCRQGLGSEALLGVFQFYKNTVASPYKTYSAAQKINFLKSYLFKLAKMYMNDEKFAKFLYIINSSSSNDFYDTKFIANFCSLFPEKKKPTVHCLTSLLDIKSHRISDEFVGFSSIPLSRASKGSLKKCGFKQISDCEYVKQ